MSHIAYVNGRYLPQKQAHVHIEDRGYQFADGIYEVTCIWNGLPVDYAGHLARLKRSLGELRIAPPMSGGAWRVILKEIIRRNHLSKGTVYMQVNRGVAPRLHTFPGKSVKPSVVVTAKHGAGPPESVAEAGVKVVTVADQRWGRCDIKSVGLLANALAKQTAAEAKAFEALLHRDGTVTEAAASNAWMVTPDQILVTHPVDNSILAGVTRGTVIKMARAAGYKVEERPFTLDETKRAKEVFLTGTTTFVMPVVQIDERPVANGSPGTVAMDLRARYRAFLDSLTADVWNV
jgi:D-alanine transaminase